MIAILVIRDMTHMIPKLDSCLAQVAKVNQLQKTLKDLHMASICNYSCIFFITKGGFFIHTLRHPSFLMWHSLVIGLSTNLICNCLYDYNMLN